MSAQVQRNVHTFQARLRRVFSLIVIASLCLVAEASAITVGGTTSTAPAKLPTTSSTADLQRGLSYAGLSPSTAPRCQGLFAIGLTGLCTHGPDPAPAGVDVTRRRSTPEIVGLAPQSYAGTTPGTSKPPTNGTGAVVCDGDGTGGKRVQTLYVVASDRTDRFDDVEQSLGQDAINADAQYNTSARQNGAARHLRFVTARWLRWLPVGPAKGDRFAFG